MENISVVKYFQNSTRERTVSPWMSS